MLNLLLWIIFHMHLYCILKSIHTKVELRISHWGVMSTPVAMSRCLIFLNEFTGTEGNLPNGNTSLFIFQLFFPHSEHGFISACATSRATPFLTQTHCRSKEWVQLSRARCQKIIFNIKSEMSQGIHVKGRLLVYGFMEELGKNINGRVKAITYVYNGKEARNVHIR